MPMQPRTSWQLPRTTLTCTLMLSGWTRHVNDWQGLCGRPWWLLEPRTTRWPASAWGLHCTPYR